MTFIYRGEVNVEKDCLDDFMNAAQALTIKGLTDGSYSQSCVSRPPYSTLAESSFSGTAYKTSHFTYPLSSAGVQYQSVQHSAQSTHGRHPMNEYHKQNGFAIENVFDSYSAQNNDDGISNNNNYSITADDDAPFVQWNDGQYETESNDDHVKMMTNVTASKRTKRNRTIGELNLIFNWLEINFMF